MKPFYEIYKVLVHYLDRVFHTPNYLWSIYLKTNIAVMITGHTRNHYDYWIRHVYPLLLEIPNSQITLFFQLWDNNPFPDFVKDNELVLKHYPVEYETKTKEEIIDSKFTVIELDQLQMYEILEKLTAKYNCINNSFYEIKSQFKDEHEKLMYFCHTLTISNYFSQCYTWQLTYKEIMNYEKQNNTTFDYVFKLRYDCFFEANFTNLIDYFKLTNADFLFPGNGVWRDCALNDNDTITGKIMSNGLYDQWFIIKHSDKTKSIIGSLLDNMILHAMLAKKTSNKILATEQCLYRSLTSLGALISTNYCSFFINRNASDFNKNFNDFINGKYIVEYVPSNGKVLLSEFYKIM